MNRSLRTRWLISYILLIIITTFILDLIVNNFLKTALSRQIESNLINQLHLIHNLVRLEMNNPSLDEITKRINQQINARITIIDINGVVLGDSDVPYDKISKLDNHRKRPEVEKAFLGLTYSNIRFSNTVKSDLMYVAMPWTENGKIQGVIRIALPLTEVEEKLSTVRYRLILGSLLAIVLAIPFGLYISNTITRPIREMISAAQQISHEKFSRKIHIDTKDELEVLSESLNTMSDKLQSRFHNIQAEKQRLETILSSMTEGVMVLDKNGRVVLMNTSLQKIFDISVEASGQTILELVRNPEVADSLINGLQQSSPFQKEIILQGPIIKNIRIYAAPLCQNGNTIGLVTVFHDITDLRTLEQIRRDFVANVSHELRTPLTTILGFSETLLESALEDREYSKKFVQNIHDQTKKMIALIEDLLTLSRIESGKAGMQFELFNPVDALDSALDIISLKAGNRNISIQKDLPDKVLFIKGDHRYIEQAFVNLLDNAIKFSQKNGIISVSVTENETNVAIAITDQGVGISTEDLPRIFERFYRVDKSRSTEIEGTGLGLAITKHIVDIHHGTIHVDSLLGKGTTFTINLPKSKSS